MPDRQPDLMRHRVSMRKTIDLAKLSLDKLKSMFKGATERDKKTLKNMISGRHYNYGTKMSALKKKKRNRRRNEIAKLSRRRNRW